MKVSNVLVLSMLMLTATISFMSIPEESTGVGVSEPTRPGSSKKVVTEVSPQAANDERKA